MHSFVLQEKNSINNFLELKRKNHIFQHHVLPWNVEWTICRKEIKLCLLVWLPKKIFCTFYLESRLNEGSVLESILVCFSLSHSNLRSNQNMILIDKSSLLKNTHLCKIQILHLVPQSPDPHHPSKWQFLKNVWIDKWFLLSSGKGSGKGRLGKVT